MIKQLFNKHEKPCKLLINISVLIVYAFYVFPLLFVQRWNQLGVSPILNWIKNLFLTPSNIGSIIVLLLLIYNLYQIFIGKKSIIKKLITYKKRPFRGWKELFIDMLPFFIFITFFFSLPVFSLYFYNLNFLYSFTQILLFDHGGQYIISLLNNYIRLLLSLLGTNGLIILSYFYIFRGFSIGTYIKDKITNHKHIFTTIMWLEIILIIFFVIMFLMPFIIGPIWL